jgi:phage baseplate assembly protein W
VIAIRFPFALNGNSGISATTNYNEIVRGQVIDALMTNQGERVFRPRYGCDVQSAVFDPRDELVRRDAAGMIQDRLETLVPRCVVRSINIELPPEEAMIYVHLVYRSSQLSTDVALTVPISSEFFLANPRHLTEQTWLPNFLNQGEDVLT